MVAGYVSLGVAIVTLILALLIHSQTNNTLSRMKSIAYTSPGAHDVERLMRDIEKTGEFRGKVVCDMPKSTHIAYSMPPSGNMSLGTLAKNRIWRFIRSAADWFSKSIDVEVEIALTTKWEIKFGNITSAETAGWLGEGWEPFSVTSDNNLWLRKRVREEKVNSQVT